MESMIHYFKVYLVVPHNYGIEAYYIPISNNIRPKSIRIRWNNK